MTRSDLYPVQDGCRKPQLTDCHAVPLLDPGNRWWSNVAADGPAAGYVVTTWLPVGNVRRWPNVTQNLQIEASTATFSHMPA
jgi:hypothetical protein